MGDHAAEMLHAAPAVYTGAGAAAHGAAGWWNTAAVPPATCSTAELAGFGTWSSALAASSYDIAVDGKAKSVVTTASSESPGNNSSVTFQEPTGVADPVGIAGVHQQQPLAGYTDWTHPYM